MPASPVTIDDVRAAAARIASSVLHTPTARSQTLGSITASELWVKFENLQFTASFKERGARNRLELLTAAGPVGGVIAASAGNHAQGLAHHAALLGVPATIVMPATTPVNKVTRTEVLGARVVLHGSSFEAAAAYATELAEAEALVLVHAFDDEAVIAGQGTVALELVADAPDLDVVVVPLGGGGLLAGMAVALRSVAPGVRIVGVEVEGYSWAAGPHPTHRPGPTVAEGIAVKQPGRLTGPLIEALVDDVLVVSEDAIERAVGLFLEIEKVVAEGAGAAALAAVLSHPEVFAGRRVGVVLSGGNIDLRLLATVAMRSLAVTGRLAVLRVPLDDAPGAMAIVTSVVAQGGGNIVDVQHVRHRASMSSRRAELVLEVEFAGPEARDRVLALLHERGIAAQLESG